jgi:Tfp pilus assembly protein PilX
LRTLRRQEGWVLVTSIAVMALMGTLGLAIYAYADGQTHQSAADRTSESSFNLAEGTLSAQVFRLSRQWPGTAAGAFPESCTQSSVDSKCPDAAALWRNFDQPDYQASTGWITTVRDNGGSSANFYDDALTNAEPRWDANNDGRLWVRSQSVVRSHRRTLVALVRVEEVLEQFPRQVVTAGRFGTTNNGNKVIVDTKGPGAQAVPLAVRCRGRNPTCLDYQQDKGQVWPDTTLEGYTGGEALTEDAVERFRSRAIASGTYYANGCPANPSGQVVFVERGDCSYTSSAGPCCNSIANPGLLIIVNGTLSMTGNSTFYGIVYMRNAQGSSANVVTLGGTAAIQGAVAIDGDGKLSAGSSKMNVVYDERMYTVMRSFGTAGIIQNTWRELKG